MPTLTLPGGRALAYAQYGAPDGTPVVLLHGTPGSRLFAPDSEDTAELGVRLITFDRPGYGNSDRREARELLDTPGDVAALTDELGIERFAVLGVSAGGGHALACAVAIPGRVSAVGVVSIPGPLDEVPGAWDALPDHQRPTAGTARREPHRSARAVARYMQQWIHDPEAYLGDGGPPADRAVKRDPRFRPMLLADVAEAFRRGAGGIADDLVALWRPWGFRIADVVPGVHLWHGAQDTRAEPDFRFFETTLRRRRSVVWEDAGHYGVVPHWREVLTVLVGRGQPPELSESY